MKESRGEGAHIYIYHLTTVVHISLICTLKQCMKENQEVEIARVNIYHSNQRTNHSNNCPELPAFKWRFWRKVVQFGQFSHFRGGRVRPGGLFAATEADLRKIVRVYFERQT